MEINKLSNEALLKSLKEQFTLERKTSHHILLHLKEIRLRRLYADRGFPNLFSMLVGYFHQSESAANQRLKALDLMMDVGVVEERLISGNLSLSTVAMAQRQIRRQEKLTSQKLSKQKKLEVVESITGKTMAQAEVELFKLLPEAAQNPKSHERRVSEDATRMSLTVPDDVREMMIRLKELWAHVDPEMDHVEVMRRAFKIALEKVDPIQKPVARRATESAKHRSTKRITYYGREFDRALWERAGSRCEYIDQKSKRRCESKFKLQKEHVIPLALGGKNELSNMQLFCATHNHHRARQVFGDKKIDFHLSKAPAQARTP